MLKTLHKIMYWYSVQQKSTLLGLVCFMKNVHCQSTTLQLNYAKNVDFSIGELDRIHSPSHG